MTYIILNGSLLWQVLLFILYFWIEHMYSKQRRYVREGRKLKGTMLPSIIQEFFDLGNSNHDEMSE